MSSVVPSSSDCVAVARCWAMAAPIQAPALVAVASSMAGPSASRPAPPGDDAAGGGGDGHHRQAERDGVAGVEAEQRPDERHREHRAAAAKQAERRADEERAGQHDNRGHWRDSRRGTLTYHYSSNVSLRRSASMTGRILVE